LGHPKCLPDLYRHPDLINFFNSFDEETVVDHPRTAGYSWDYAFGRMLSLPSPGNVLYTLEAVIRSFYFV